MKFKQWLVEQLTEPNNFTNKDPDTTVRQNAYGSEDEDQSEIPMGMRTHKATQAFAIMTAKSKKMKKR